MGRSPKISILLPVFNGQSYLKSTLASIISQTFEDFELLIMDDGSTDDSLLVIDAFQQTDKRIQVFHNKANYGVGYCLSRLLSQCSGEFVAQIGQDDVWKPSFLESLLKAISTQLNVSAYFCVPEIIDQNDTLILNRNLFKTDEIGQLNEHELFAQLFKGNFLCAASSLFRRALLDRTLLELRLDYLQDWFYWLNLLQKGRFGLVKEKLVQYRIHGKNQSLNHARPRQLEMELFRIRLNIIGNAIWPSWINGSHDPDAYFRELMASFLNLCRPWRPDDYSGLLLALRENEMSLLNIKSFRELMTLLLWAEGSFGESRVYGRVEDCLSRWPELRGLWQNRWIFEYKSMTQPVRWHRWRLRKSNLPCIIPVFTKGMALEKYMEKVFNFGVKGYTNFWFNIARELHKRLLG